MSSKNSQPVKGDSSLSVRIPDFGIRMREAFSGANNAHIAKEMKKTEAGIKNYIDGRVTLPVVMEIAFLTGCSVDWLLTGKGMKKPAEISIDELLENKIRKLIQEVIGKTTAVKETPAQDLGIIDEPAPEPQFNLETAIEKYKTLENTLEAWFNFEGKQVPDDFLVEFHSWDKMSLEDKLITVRQIKDLAEEIMSSKEITE